MAELRRSRDTEPGFARRRRGKGFSYVDERGERITNERRLQRIESLAIPPAWRDVWICRSGRAHLQATGIDAAGRKQYLYHPAWQEDQEREKFERILCFAERLPRIRRASRRDLRRDTLDRDRALATAVQILDRTSLRIGSEQYVKSNGTFGLATIRSRHVDVDGDEVALDFEGKSGVRQRATIDDALIAAAVDEMDELPGRELFKYRDDDGTISDVRSEDINGYIKKHMGEEFSAKDFRTWSATVATAVALDEFEPVISDRAGRRAVASVVRTVAELLGNTPAVCRASYIDPRVIDQFQDGNTISALRADVDTAAARGLTVQERLVLSLLRRGLDDRIGTRSKAAR